MEQWPAISGKIEDAWAEAGSGGRGSAIALVKIRYTYSYNGAAFAGEYKRGFNDEDTAREFAYGLKGRDVMVHVNPDRPTKSGLLTRDVDVVVSERGAVPEGALPPDKPAPVSSLKKMFALPFAAIALAGFVISMAVNIAGWMGKVILPSSMFAAMHIGVFLVFFPAVLLAGRRRNGLPWKFKKRENGSGMPGWALKFAGFIFIYAMANFIIFIFTAGSSKQHGAPSAIMWRGFSGHWMVFYLFSFGMLYTVISAPSDKAKCVNGHEMNSDALVCPVCGAGREQTA